MTHPRSTTHKPCFFWYLERVYTISSASKRLGVVNQSSTIIMTNTGKEKSTKVSQSSSEGEILTDIQDGITSDDAGKDESWTSLIW